MVRLTATAGPLTATANITVSSASAVPVFLTPAAGDALTSAQQVAAHSSWVTGLATYTAVDVSYSGAWTAQVAAFPAGQDVLTMARGTTGAGAAKFLKSFPAAWQDPRFMRIICPSQEMEDNLKGNASAIAAYLAQQADVAAGVRPLGALSGIELQEWFLNPANPDVGLQMAKQIVNPAAIDIYVWSVLNHQQVQTSVAQVDRVVAWMAANAPGKPWGIASGGAAISLTNPTDAQRQACLQINQTLWPYARSKGAVCLGYYGSWGADKDNDYRLSSNPLLTDAVMTTAMKG